MEKGTMDRQFVSNLAFMHKRDIRPEVADIFDEMNQVVDIMELCGRYVPTVNDEYTMHVNTRLHSAATIDGALAAPTAGAASTVSLTAGSVKPRVNDVMMTAGGYRSFVRAVSGDDITVFPVAGDLAHEAFTGDEKVTFFTNAYPEGSTIQPGYKFPTEVYTNNIQIIREGFEITDLEATNEVEVKFNGQNYYMIKGVGDSFNRYRLQVAFAWLFGERSNGLTDANGDEILMTEGLEKAIRNNGIVLQQRIDTNANLEADFYALNRALDQARGPKEYWKWDGAEVKNSFDNWLTTKEGLTDGGIVYNSFNGMGDGKKRSVYLGFDSFKIWSRTWHMKSLDAFDNIEVSAAEGFNYPTMSMSIPANKVKVDHDQGMIDRFRIRYKKAPKGYGLGLNDTRMYYEVVTGGLSENKTNQTMKHEISWTTWQGAEFTGLAHFGISTL
jgi:hypothetical protein